ncbi:MAG: hypothetical protein ACI84R_003867, partial [Candidatus Azotimanducaceae bacterium]
ACFRIPIICASLYRAVFIKNLLSYLAEKILLLNTTNFRGDYRGPFDEVLVPCLCHHRVKPKACESARFVGLRPDQ